MIRVLSLLIALSFLAACGSSSSSSTGATSLATLPKATGATSAAATSISMQGGQLHSASTGTNLSNWYSAFNGQTSKSQTFCQLGATLREVIRGASQPDKIACYMGVMETYASISGWPTNGSDGNFHYVTVTGASRIGKRNDGKVKFRITKSGGVITSMEMFSAFGTVSQGEYISMSTSGSNITLTSVNTHSGGGYTGKGRVTVTGTIDSNGTWTSAKTIVAEGYHTETSSGRAENMRVDLTQYSDRFLVQGYRTGSDSSKRATFTDSVYSLVQLVTASPLSSLTLGEGTAKVSMTHSSYGSFAQTRAWNGDTGAPISPATTADYYSTVDAATLPSAPSSYNVDFSASETWDTTVPSGETQSTGDLAALQADATAAAAFTACDTNYGFSDGSWPDCWALSDN